MAVALAVMAENAAPDTIVDGPGSAAALGLSRCDQFDQWLGSQAAVSKNGPVYVKHPFACPKTILRQEH